MSDAKAWRRGIMSDDEACDEYDKSIPEGIWSQRGRIAIGSVLDEFVRRLGEMRVGGSGGYGFHYPCSDKGCRPAVLFVQREAEKVTPENCPCRMSADDRCCNGHSDCCVCHSGMRTYKRVACLKCGRQPETIVSECPCDKKESCCRSVKSNDGHCVCHAGGEYACTRCGRKPEKPKPPSARPEGSPIEVVCWNCGQTLNVPKPRLSDAEKVERALAEHDHHTRDMRCLATEKMAAILRGESE